MKVMKNFSKSRRNLEFLFLSVSLFLFFPSFLFSFLFLFVNQKERYPASQTRSLEDFRKGGVLLVDQIRFAACWYDDCPSTLPFLIKGSHFQVACYFVDFINTNRREIDVFATLGEDQKKGGEKEKEEKEREEKEIVSLKGKNFHEGQWVIWKVHSKEKTNIFNLHLSFGVGPNWVISSLLLDELSPNEIPSSSSSSSIVQFSHIDNQTQGNWKDKYGSSGGIQFSASKQVLIPSTSETVSLLKYDQTLCGSYDWCWSFTTDRRALQVYCGSNIVQLKPAKR